jgi:hypothetical protein
VRDEFGGNGLADEAGEVGRHHFHPALQVSLDLCPELEHPQGLEAQLLQALDVKLADFLPHRVVGSLHYALSQLTVPNDGLDVLQGGGGGGPVADKGDQADKDVVVGDDPGEFGEVPGVPLLDPHGEGVDVLVEQFEQTDGLDDGLVLPVHVQRDLVPGEGVRQAQPRLLQLHVLELLVLQETQEVLADSPDQLGDHRRSGRLDLQRLIDRARQVPLTHSQLDLRLFLEGEVLRKKINHLLRGFPSERVGDHFQRSGRGLKGVESLSVE